MPGSHEGSFLTRFKGMSADPGKEEKNYITERYRVHKPGTRIRGYVELSSRGFHQIYERVRFICFNSVSMR